MQVEKRVLLFGREKLGGHNQRHNKQDLHPGQTLWESTDRGRGVEGGGCKEGAVECQRARGSDIRRT